jgi:hypothetical protein
MAKKLKISVAGAALLVLLLGCYWAFSPSKITVYPNRQLVWKDFKQVPLINGSESINATCFSTTDFQINRIYDEGTHKRIDLKAIIALHEERSQVSLHFLKRANGETKKQVLHHENGHFKIAQIIGRRIVQNVDSFPFHPADYQTQLDSIVRSHYKEWSRLDQEYDYETTKPRNLEKQKEWDLWFKEELEKAGG